MILQLLYEANTCLPCSVSEMPNTLRNEIRLRLNGFLSVIENLESPALAAALPLEIVKRETRLAVIRPMPVNLPLTSAS